MQIHRLNFGLLFCLSALAGSACATVPTASSTPRTPILLDQVEKLQVGSDGRDRILALFGAPSRKLPPGGAHKKEYWIYSEGADPRSTRLSLGIEPSTGVLESVFWDVRDQDPEKDLATVRARYPHANFRQAAVEWSTPDYSEAERHLKDEKLGITVVYHSIRKRVEGIGWSVKKPRSPAKNQR